MAQPTDPLEKPRRFYKAVTVEARDGGFAVSLDGRTPRSPRGHPLVLPTAELGELVADEWRRQGETILFASMPATRLAHTALDVPQTARRQVLEGVLRFAEADLLCYFAEGPSALVRRQEAVWGPLLDWVATEFDLRFRRTVGVVHRDQPPESRERLTAILESLDDFSLVGLAFVAALFGSAILALALRAGRVDAAAAMEAARLDETFQEEQWGVDAEAAARAARLGSEAALAERWFTALRRRVDDLVTDAGEG